MNRSIYSKLALTNIKNNRKTYVPYILTAVLTVMMFYIMDALARNGNITDGSLKLCMQYAVAVIMIFSVIFLFYTNSFLIKRRKREIGIYNILGMGKRHIAKMLAVETVVTAVISIGGGIVMGIIFSKLMFLFLLKLLRYDIQMSFEMPMQSFVNTLILFGIIFAVTLIYNLLQIKLANPVELVRGSSQGEKEPRSKWLLAIIGVVLIGIGYTIALTVESPLAALGIFFVAVVCVILGTYAVFIAGSVAFLKMLRKNKKYYYKTKHFTSVSGMIYRMKQNAVGLANIAILSTMVLVMISTTVSLYVGMEDVLKFRFPYEVSISGYQTTPEYEAQIETVVEEETRAHDVEAVSNISYRSGTFPVYQDGDTFEKDEAGYGLPDVYTLTLMPLADYNATEGKNETLAEDEVLIFYDGMEEYGKDQVKLNNQTYHVKKELKKMKICEKSESQVVNGYIMVIKDDAAILEHLKEAYSDSSLNEEFRAQMSEMQYYRAFDLKGKKEDVLETEQAILTRLAEEVPLTSSEGRELSRSSFYMLYGGLLFIGIYLGTLFLMATVLIIYYKQISEGYDDRQRYQIMQKVGMSRSEVKRSIRSQILTVFFLPLVTAVIHIAVAFKIITKLLAMMQLVNVSLFLGCTVATVVVFAVFYGIVYVLTAREYYKIVK